MKGIKLGTVLSIFLSVLLLLAQGITLFTLWKLDMLPEKFLILVGMVLACVWGLITILLFFPSRRTVKVRRVIASILIVAIVVGCGAVSGVSAQLKQTIHAITSPDSVSTGLGVYVLAENPAISISDTADYTFAVAQITGSSINQKALSLLDQTLGISVKSAHYPSVPEMVNALYSGLVGAIIMDSAYVDILQEFELYQNFQTKTRLIHEIIVAEETPPTVSDSTDPTDPSGGNSVSPITTAPFVIYISGSDTRNPTLSKSRSDVNILAVVNPSTKQILLINTPRDYYIPNPAGNGALDKLTHCGIFGVSCSMQALSDLYRVPVDYYAQINFTGFQTLIDAIGGIQVYSEIAFTAPGVTIVQGMNSLNGAQALAFARERYALPGGDNARGKNQMKVISAVIAKLTSGSTIISNYGSILESLQGMFQTDLTTREIADLVKMQLSDMASWNILSYAVTGKGSSDVTYSMPGQMVYVMRPNQETVDHAAELIDRVFAGEALTQSDMTLSS